MYKKFIIGITLLVVAVVVVYAFHLLREYMNITTSESKVVQKQKSSKELLTERIKVAKYMHELTNGLIVAENNKIGNVRTMNKKNIEEVLDMAENIAVSAEQKHLVNIIGDWKKGDLKATLLFAQFHCLI